MKCMHCNMEFTPTKEESILLEKYPVIHKDENEKVIKQGIPFCSAICFRNYFPDRSIPNHDSLWYSNGVLKTIPDIINNSFGIDRLICRPISENEKRLVDKRRGRDGFSYGASVCILPSAGFYGKNNPLSKKWRMT